MLQIKQRNLKKNALYPFTELIVTISYEVRYDLGYDTYSFRIESNMP